MLRRTYTNNREAREGIELYSRKGYSVKSIIEVGNTISIAYEKESTPFTFA